MELAESERFGDGYLFPNSYSMFDGGMWCWSDAGRIPVVPQPDWLQGLKDVAEWARKVYTNPSIYEQSSRCKTAPWESFCKGWLNALERFTRWLSTL